MKRCPRCNRSYTDLSLNFCLDDGTPLASETPSPPDPHATVRYPPIRDTGEPPPTEIYPQQQPVLNQAPEVIRPRRRWSPGQAVPGKKSNAIWWVLGGLAVIAVIGTGLVIMIIALASIGRNPNKNVNGTSNANVRAVNRHSPDNTTPVNANTTSNLPSSVTDDFSEQKWGTGNSQFGDIWYADDEYHMRSKEKTFLVMYAPGNEYNTGNATVRVTARSVDGSATTSGFGLIIHGEKTKSSELEDYGLLLYTGAEPQYQIVMHKNGNQTPLVPWTKSSVVRSGTSPNQLEARITGNEISFYINGQYVNRITDNENFKQGLAGLYTSDTVEIAFDDLEINR